MKKKISLKIIWLFLKKYNVITFALCFIPFFIFLIYPIKESLKGDFPENYLALSVLTALFPALIIFSFVSFIRQQSSTFWLKSLVEIIVLAARVDGSISSKDRRIMIASFKSQLGSAKMKKALIYFDSITEDTSLDLERSCNRLMKVFDVTNSVILLDVIVKVAISDQYLSAKEEDFLNSLCDKLGLPSSSLSSILARRVFVSENNIKQESKQTSFKRGYSSLYTYYKVLGLSDSASFFEVKKSYRDLAKLYHPDKIRNKDLKENAKRQFQEITEAYNIIKNQKG